MLYAVSYCLRPVLRDFRERPEVTPAQVSMRLEKLSSFAIGLDSRRSLFVQHIILQLIV